MEALVFSIQSTNHLILQSQWKAFPRRSLRRHGAGSGPGASSRAPEASADPQTHVQLCEELQGSEEASGQPLQLVVGQGAANRRPVNGAGRPKGRGVTGTYRWVSDRRPLKANSDSVSISLFSMNLRKERS